MKKNPDIIPDFNDLLFESRNKDYGAYQLRKKYHRVLVGGIIIASLFGCLAVITPFMISRPNDHIISGGGRSVTVHMDNLVPPKEEIYIPPAPPPPSKTNPQDIVKYVPPVVIDTVIPIEQSQMITDEALAHSGDTNVVVTGTGTGDDLFSREGSSTEEPFILVETMPSFRGGDLNKFRDWVQKRLNYPQEALSRNIQGRVLLTFIIETDGSVSNVSIVRGVDPLIDNEAVKTIGTSPKWTPGLQRGQPVRVRYSLWLNFKI